MLDERSPLLRYAKSSKPRPLGITKLIAGLVGVFLAGADKSILLTTQNKIASSLQSPSSAPLLLVSYNLGFCIALPVRTTVVQRFKSYCIFLILTSNPSGVVDSVWPFAFGRFLAGVGGSGMTDLLSVLINEVFDVTEIASVRSYVIAAEIFGHGCGGPLGGIITDNVGWRWALLGQAPIGILCLILAYWQLPKLPKKYDVEPRLSLWSFDYLGLGAFIISTTSFVLGTTNGSPALDGKKPALFTTSAIFLAILIFIEKMSSRPIFPASIVPAPGLRNVFLGQVMFFANISIVLNNLPSYLSQVQNLTSSQIALRIWPSSLGLILGAIIAGKVLRKTVKYREVSLIGVGASVSSLVVMIIRWMNGINGAEVHYGFPWAVGAGILLSAQFLTLTKWSPVDQMANATAIYCLAQQIGQIVGTSGSTAAFKQLFSLRLGVNLSDTPLDKRTEIIHKILQNYGSIADLPDALQRAVQYSYIEAFRLIPALATILATISGILILFT
ncbi:MFS general substrate transporter [Penicillium paradoxum]|uniref:MFS general substrate transporter n=1 Tax=Penicillium paradoxum TaxID=176176 RepID=UPI00254865E2|nr:MFS general substrate transporter [Penicillium paradoxum]KAJ5787325.1 MFS general substrate transporter [Penicillium paradoxum]